jgi:Ribbon-helix-helix protein, copG family
MTRTQIQLPEPLFGRLRRIAQARDISVAEVIRRGMEIYAMSCPETDLAAKSWTLPVLRGSGGHLVDPASIKSEAAAIEERFQRP